VRAFGEFNVTLVGRVDQKRKQRLCHIGWRVAIPFRINQECRHGDLGRVVIRFTSAEEVETIRDDPIWCANGGRAGLGPIPRGA
jgi:hypothetical protein